MTTPRVDQLGVHLGRIQTSPSPRRLIQTWRGRWKLSVPQILIRSLTSGTRQLVMWREMTSIRLSVRFVTGIWKHPSYRWSMLIRSTQLYFMIVYFAPMFCSTQSGICSLIVRKTTLCATNATVHTRTRTHWNNTWSPDIQSSQHRQVWKVHTRVLYVVNVTCIVVQRLHSEFILLLIKRHHVLSVHRNSSTLPAETSTSAWGTATGVTGNWTADWLRSASRPSTIWRNWVFIQGRHIAKCTGLDVVIKIVLTVTER